MSRRCSRTTNCDQPGLIYIGPTYVCERHAEELRAEMATAAAMANPLTPAEWDINTAQLANSFSLENIFPALRDPAILAQQIEFWKEQEQHK